MSAFIGIDLGTTFSAVATLDATGRPTIVHNAEGHNLTPSCVSEEDGVIIVGNSARRTYATSSGLAAARFKREMGTAATHKINGREFTPLELSALVLKKLKKDAEAAIGGIGEAVVTIPANFSNEAREATMAAAKMAGLDVKFIVNEPTAAALYYAFQSGEDLSGIYAVYDLGGGTFDVSVIRVNGQNVEVLASDGVSRLGGDDFDEQIRSVVARKYASQAGGEFDPDDFNKADAEQAKLSLSERQKTVVRVGRKTIEITRDDFVQAIGSQIAQAEMLCESTLDEAGVEVRDIRSVFLAGGSTRIPLVRESVKRVFGQEPVSSVNVDEVVALGAALYAAYRGDQTKLSPVQRQAVQKIKVAERTGKCFGTLALIHDEARGDVKIRNSVLIRKGESIPCSVTETFYTIRAGQTAVECELTESDAPETDPQFVKVIWKGELELPPNRPGDQEIRVTYAYDDNQIMKCSFVDVASGREQKVDINPAGRSEQGGIDRFLIE
jgi:molecular chaperone DnaK